MIHVQHEEERAFYALERLWRDCPSIPLPEGVAAAAATPDRSEDEDDVAPADPAGDTAGD